MTQHAGWPVLVDWMHQRMESPKKAILNGRIPTHEDYLTTTGYLKGIHEVIDAPKKVADLVLNEQGRRQEREEAIADEG